MYRDTSSVDCAPRELTHASSFLKPSSTQSYCLQVYRCLISFTIPTTIKN